MSEVQSQWHGTASNGLGLSSSLFPTVASSSRLACFTMSWSDDFNSKWINESEDVNIIAWSFAVFATFISLCHVIQHLVNFAMPGIQIYVVRILLIIPIYSISSACAIQLGVNGLYAETPFDFGFPFLVHMRCETSTSHIIFISIFSSLSLITLM